MYSPHLYNCFCLSAKLKKSSFWLLTWSLSVFPHSLSELTLQSPILINSSIEKSLPFHFHLAFSLTQENFLKVIFIVIVYLVVAGLFTILSIRVKWQGQKAEATCIFFFHFFLSTSKKPPSCQRSLARDGEEGKWKRCFCLQGSLVALMCRNCKTRKISIPNPNTELGGIQEENDYP